MTSFTSKFIFLSQHISNFCFERSIWKLNKLCRNFITKQDYVINKCPSENIPSIGGLFILCTKNGKIKGQHILTYFIPIPSIPPALLFTKFKIEKILCFVISYKLWDRTKKIFIKLFYVT